MGEVDKSVTNLNLANQLKRAIVQLETSKPREWLLNATVKEILRESWTVGLDLHD